jgi:hypothetical protein
MSENSTTIILKAVFRLLRPLVRILLRNGLPYGAFADIAKQAYVDVATKEFGLPGRKQTHSRVAILTGLTRKEILRLSRLPEPLDDVGERDYNRAARVVSGWLSDKRYCDERGEPVPLSPEGSFAELVRAHSGDMPPRAVMDELLRVGAIRWNEQQQLELCAKAYVPQTGEREKLTILGVAASDLLTTIDHNLRSSGKDSRLQLSVAYDNLPVEIIEELRALSNEQAMLMLRRLDQYLAQHDRDRNPDANGTGRMRAGVGIYYFQESVQEGDGTS